MPMTKTRRIALALLLGALPSLAAAKDILIDDSAVFPESVAADAAGNVYASSLKGFVYRATPGSDKAIVWIRPDDTNKLLWTLGLLPHEASNTLWVCTTPAAFLNPPKTGDAALVSFDLKTGAFKARYPLPKAEGTGPGASATCNDIGVGQNGKVYVTDTSAGRLFSLSPGETALKVESADPMLNGVEGPAFSSDNKLYINNTRQNTILRVERDGNGNFTGFTKLELSMPLNGADGFRHYKDNQFVQAETGGTGRLTLVTITGDKADVKVIAEGTGSAGVAVHGDTVYSAAGKIEYLFGPNAGKDPGQFVIKATPIGGAK